ncbi:MAG: hypothetical protein ABI254_12250 [Chthoniobacterales bacterium]
MAIIIECNYAKKLGLPGYSSHQYSVTVRTEISDIGNLAKANEELYRALQDAVDTQIENTGFIPGLPSINGKHTNGNGSSNGSSNGAWNCSDKQRDLILKLIEEHNLPTANIESLCQERFGKELKHLNKLDASGLIDELFEKVGEKPLREQRPRNGTSRPFSKGGVR